MNKKGQEVAGVGELVFIFIAIIIGIAMISSIINTQDLVTEKQTMVNDSITYSGLSDEDQINESLQFNVTKAQSDWRTTSCPISSYTFTNSTGTEYEETTDYVFTPAYGNFTLVNTAKVNASMQSDNKTYVSYSYCDTGYNTSSSSRGVARLWGIFGALIILSAAVYGIRRWF